MQRLYKRLAWGKLAAAGFGLFLLDAVWLEGHHLRSESATMCLAVGLDILVGLATTCLIVSCTRSAHAAGLDSDKRLPVTLRLLESRWAISLGAFSYSLYLVHVPIVLKLGQWAGSHFPPVRAFLVELAGIPFVLAAAYLFHLAFERRFTAAHRPHGEKTSAA